MELAGKTIVITGGGRGLGAAMAKRLATTGCSLALVDLDAGALAETADACRAAGAAEARTFTANVAVEAEVEKLFADIASDFGSLDGLVNNAGITRDALTLKYKDGEQVSKMSLEQWQTVIDVNLTGVFLCGREAAAKMIEFGRSGGQDDRIRCRWLHHQHFLDLAGRQYGAVELLRDQGGGRSDGCRMGQGIRALWHSRRVGRTGIHRHRDGHVDEARGT
jgi:NAD(P)-dependent dehydrogenase (short-subunit alcohol dehydrogenase family)